MTLPQNKPFIMEMNPGRYAWCTCSMSNKQPFCDGSHGPVGKYPKIAHIEEQRTVAWCGCKMTKTPPYCDGSHTKILG